MTDATGADLLRGPRGRRVCLSLLAETDPHLRALEGRAGVGIASSNFISTLTDLVTDASEQLPSEFGEFALMTALLESVDAARYWQEPYEIDRLLADTRVQAALAPVAEAVASASRGGVVVGAARS